jgi:hypothetical protein
MGLNILPAIWKAHHLQEYPHRKKGLTWMLSLMALPSMGALAWVGATWAQEGMEATEPGLALGGFMLGLALLSSLWDGSCVLRFEPLRPFRLHPAELFLAEIILGAWTPMKRFLWAAGLAFALGAAWVHPRALPWLLMALPAGMALFLALERVTGLLARCFGRTLKSMLIFGTLFMLLRLLLADLMEGGNLRGLATGQHLVSLHGTSCAAFLPTTWLLASLQAAAQRGWPSLGFLAFFAVAILAPFFALLLLKAELLGEQISKGSTNTKPLRFRKAWIGVAHLHWHQLWHSKLGRIFLFLPLLALTGLIDPLAFGFKPGSTWILAWVGLALLPPGRTFASNLFGLERGGVRSYWLLPLEDRDLLLGKALAVGLYQALILALLAPCLALATPLRPLEVVGAAIYGLALCLWQQGIGLRRSLQAPFPLDPEGLNPIELDDPTLVTLGYLFMPWALQTVIWGLAARFDTRYAIAAMCVSALLGLRFAARRLHQAEALLVTHRETLTLHLEGRQP